MVMASEPNTASKVEQVESQKRDTTLACAVPKLDTGGDLEFR